MTQSSNTSHEHLLRVRLWRRGPRYRKNVRTLPGKPDIVFARERLAVFCDGDFWHGRDWHRLSRKLRTGSNACYWIQKIKGNRSRDRQTDQLLKSAGWTVVRVWETDIRRDPDQAADKIAEFIRKNKRGFNAIH